jgi:hypothetical protein
VIKDPNALLPFAVDWSAWLTAENDTADSFTWIVPDGLVKEDEQADGGKATVWLSGGVDGKNYAVVCRLTTTGGRVDDRTMQINVRQR